MSWAEVKKINSDLSTPLNELINNNVSFPNTTYGKFSNSSKEISVNGKGKIILFSKTNAIFEATIILDNTTIGNILIGDTHVNNLALTFESSINVEVTSNYERGSYIIQTV